METNSVQYVVELSNDQGLETNTNPNPSDVERFQSAYAKNSTNGLQATQSSVVVGVDSKAMGDRILEGLQSMKSGYDQQIEKVQNTIMKTDGLNIQDMLKLQLDLATLSMQGELINKTVSKSTQNIDTMLKSQ